MSRFDEITNRRNTGSLKWDVKDGELPMWVADMDFKTAPSITDALRKITERGIYGYSVITDEWYDAYINWWSTQHGFVMEKEWLIFCTGVVPAISSVVRKVTTPAENVVIMTPVYNIFFNSILNNGRNVLECRLKYEAGRCEIDFIDLEEKLSNPQTTLLILCNPQNPIGKVWDKDTLERVGILCEKYGVIVISDEIHCDIVSPGISYVPYAGVSQICKNNSITCIAPTKAFNIAGIQTAAVVVPNEHLRNKIYRCLNTDEVAEPNVFAINAAIAAFNGGKEWLRELNEYVWENKKIAVDYINENIMGIRTFLNDATYLIWIDCRGITDDDVDLCRHIRQRTGLYLSEGSEYGNGKGFLRMNLACSRNTLKDGLCRLKEGILTYNKTKRD